MGNFKVSLQFDSNFTHIWLAVFQFHLRCRIWLTWLYSATQMPNMVLKLQIPHTVVYFWNQSSIKHLKRKMSYEALFDEKSDLSNFKIIDCQVWALISKKKCSKFDLRFNDCRLLEYAASMQYILYEMNSDWVIFSHDVIFDELSEFYSSNWIFDFDLSDKLLLTICFYT